MVAKLKNLCYTTIRVAGVLELADRQDKGSCGCMLLWVQVPSTAF